MNLQLVNRSGVDRRIYDPDFSIPLDRRLEKDRRKPGISGIEMFSSAIGKSDSYWDMLFKRSPK